MAGGGEKEDGGARSRRTGSLRTATALVFSFGCGATSGFSWDYLLGLML